MTPYKVILPIRMLCEKVVSTSIPIITVVGYSNAGKTRCMTELIAHLTARGWRVAAAKHCHDDFQLDVEGKDSWQHKQAGAVTTIMSNRHQLGAVVTPARPLTLAEICAQYVYDADILLAEGYSWEPHPKILVTSCARLDDERVKVEDAVIALVGTRYENLSVAQFESDQFDDLALLVEKEFLLPKTADTSPSEAPELKEWS